jgi:CubicO group peptidase (beta-lactamase class C family)
LNPYNLNYEYEGWGVELSGIVEPGFGPVADAFAQNFALRGEVGAAFCLYQDGRCVVDIQGGVRAQDGVQEAYDQDTIQVVFSCTKGITALAAHMLVQRGLLDLDAPVTRYWPEYGAVGKQATRVGWLLSHRAGLPVCEAPLTRGQACDGRTVAAALARQPACWEPGTAHGYHALTFGFLAGEVIRRVSGRSVGRFVAEEIAAPLGLDTWIGLPHGQQHRLAHILPPAARAGPELRSQLRRLGPDSPGGRALTLNGTLPISPALIAYNDPAVLAAELPSSNGVSSARSLARLYAAAIGEVDGIQLLSAQARAAATRPQSTGLDRVLGVETRFGHGFMLPSAEMPMLSPASFGHAGAGGSIGLADPDLNAGLAYTANQMGPHLLADPRATALVAAVRSSLSRH